AYTWQRITSWILLIGIIAHVVHMRFMEYPASARQGSQHYYMVRVQADEGLYTLAKRLGVKLYDPQEIERLSVPQPKTEEGVLKQGPKDLLKVKKKKENQDWIKALEKRPLRKGEVITVSPDFGTAELLMVRETFKMPLMLALYTILVLSACFHGFNGLWT